MKVHLIIVQDTFVCKPGYASKVAKLFKEAMSKNPTVVRVMTDYSGQFNWVVMLSQFESLAAYEGMWEIMENPPKEMEESMKKMESYQETHLTGSRKIFRIL